MRRLAILFFLGAAALHAEPALLHIQSEPPGADVYVDGVLSGKTPLEIPASVLRHVRLSKDGYQDSRLPVRADSSSEILIIMRRSIAAHDTGANPAVTPAGAMLRSMLLPGWGQASKGDSSGYWFGLGSMAAAGAYFYYGAESRLAQDRVISKYQMADIRLAGYGSVSAALVPTVASYYSAFTQHGVASYIAHGDRNVADTLAKTCFSSTNLFSFDLTKKDCRAYRHAKSKQRYAGYAFLGIYTWNVLDALLSDPQVPVAALPVFGEDQGFLVAARLRF
jgi:hypothetical protein